VQIADVYDNQQLQDRYTVIFQGGDALALSEHPEEDSGFARWIIVDEYDQNRLGQRIDFRSLPENVQTYVLTRINDGRPNSFISNQWT